MSLTIPNLITIAEVLNEKIKLQKQLISRVEIDTLKMSYIFRLKVYEIALKAVEDEIAEKEKEFDLLI